MAELYSTGLQKIFYQAKAKQNGIVVTVKFCLGCDEGSSIIRMLTESASFPGIYSFSYNFSAGVYLASFFEEGIRSISQVYRFSDTQSKSVIFRGPNVVG